MPGVAVMNRWQPIFVNADRFRSEQRRCCVLRIYRRRRPEVTEAGAKEPKQSNMFLIIFKGLLALSVITLIYVISELSVFVAN